MGKETASCYNLTLKQSKLVEITKERMLSTLTEVTKTKMDSKIKNATYKDLIKLFPKHIQKVTPGIYQLHVDKNNDMYILLNKTQDDLMKVLVKLGYVAPKSPSKGSEVSITQVTDKATLKQFYDDWSITWEGMSTDEKNLKDIKKAINEAGGKFNGHFHVIKGDFFNKAYGLTGRNAYPEDLSILVITTKDCPGRDKLIMWIRMCGARWYTDVIDNNARRQKSR